MATQSLTVRFLGDAKPLRQTLSGLKGMLKLAPIAAAGTAAVAVGALVYKGLKRGIEAATEFEAEIAKVYTLMADAPQSTLDKVEKSVRDIAKEFGTSIPDAAKLAYDAISNGIDPASLDTYAKAVGKTALAIGASLSDTGNLFLKVKANFRDLADSDISNVIANAVKYGAANGQQMAANLGDVLALSKALGMSFSDSAMAYSALVGTSGAEGAKTQVGALMSEIMGKSGKFAGIGIDAKSIKAEGIMGIVAKLQKAIGNSPVKLHDFLSTKEAKLAFSNLISQLPLIKAGIEGIRLHPETADLMAGKAMDTLAFKTAKMKAAWNDSFINIGEKLLPTLKRITDEFTKEDNIKNFTVGLQNLASVIAAMVGPMTNLLKVAGMVLSIFDDKTFTENMANLINGAAGVADDRETNKKPVTTDAEKVAELKRQLDKANKEIGQYSMFNDTDLKRNPEYAAMLNQRDLYKAQMAKYADRERARMDKAEANKPEAQRQAELAAFLKAIEENTRKVEVK